MDEKPELRLVGYPARLIIELEDGEHDISHLLEMARVGEMTGKYPWPPSGGWSLDFDALAREVQIELRARERASGKATT